MYVRALLLASTSFTSPQGARGWMCPRADSLLGQNLPFYQNCLGLVILVLSQDQMEQLFPLLKRIATAGQDNQSHPGPSPLPTAHDQLPRAEQALAHSPEQPPPSLPLASLAVGHVNAVRAGGKGRL